MDRTDLQQWRGRLVSAGLVSSVRHGRGHSEVLGHPGLGHPDGEGLVSAGLDGVQLVPQVRHQPRPDGDVHAGGGQAPADLRGAGCVASSVSVHVEAGVHCQHLLPLQLPQVLHCELQHVSLLQLADALPLGLQREHHQVLQLVQAAVDAGAPLPLDQGLHHFSVLVSLGQWLVSKWDFYFDSRRHGDNSG